MQDMPKLIMQAMPKLIMQAIKAMFDLTAALIHALNV